jgi:flagellar hook-associated protein FlgK
MRGFFIAWKCGLCVLGGEMKPMFKKSLSKIVSSFSDTVSQLEALIGQNKTQIESNVAQVNRLEVENADLTNESSKAARISDKLKSILE